MPSAGRPPRPAIERFVRQIVNVPSGCIEWTGVIDRYGYGQFRGPRGVMMGAHRFAYEHHVGPIPTGLHIDHLCRNRKCVNPAHLEAVTVRENLFRSPIAPAAINAAKTHCPKNHPLSGANLYVDPKGGRRHCRACRRENDRQRKARIARKAA